MAEEIKTLNLDEMIGQTKAVSVRRNGIDYGLADMKSLGVHKILQFQAWRRKATMLQLIEELSEEQSKEIEKMFDQMLGVLSDDLPINELSYPEKTTILAFYFTETAPKKVTSPNRESLTGATSSQS